PPPSPPTPASNRRPSPPRRISDLGLGISPLADKKARRIAALLPCRPRRRLFRGGENPGLRWRFPSASGGGFNRPQVAISVGLGWRLRSASGGDCGRPGQPGHPILFRGNRQGFVEARRSLDQ